MHNCIASFKRNVTLDASLELSNSLLLLVYGLVVLSPLVPNNTPPLRPYAYLFPIDYIGLIPIAIALLQLVAISKGKRWLRLCVASAAMTWWLLNGFGSAMVQSPSAIMYFWASSRMAWMTLRGLR